MYNFFLNWVWNIHTFCILSVNPLPKNKGARWKAGLSAHHQNVYTMKTMKNHYSIYLLLFLFLSSWSSGEGLSFKVSGTVIDAADGSPLRGVQLKLKGSRQGSVTDKQGEFEILFPSEASVLVFSFPGYESREVKVGKKRNLQVVLKQEIAVPEEEIVLDLEVQEERHLAGRTSSPRLSHTFISQEPHFPPHNTEEYATIHESIFLETLKNPLSTFSIDVDNASYSNMRRYINNGQRPPKDAVRIEEMVNYFSYDYPEPAGEEPFSVNTEVSGCPWNSDHRLVHIGLQGKKIATENLPASNLVFLIDVSGSMDAPNRLPLVKAAFKLLINELRPQDRVSIVVYAGAAGMVLPSTAGDKKAEILEAIEKLQAGGSTAGGAGIQLAYQLARENFIQEGNNRVILATDGDFNVGVSSNAAMERLIEKERESGVFLTVLGFGMGNYKDSKMEILADKGNGNYAYIDNILEAKKVFVNEFGGTSFTIAKDVKLQLEFNPAKVQAYRLIGYENRALKNEDFNNDKKDAGDLGSGHTVTALYEIIPVGVKDSPFLQSVDSLKYQQNGTISPSAYDSKELFTVKLRYKKPDGNTSSLIEKVVFDQQLPLLRTSDNFRFSASVASFGLLLRDSEFKGDATFAEVLELAKGAKGKDEEGYRLEFINMVRSMELLAER